MPGDSSAVSIGSPSRAFAGIDSPTAKTAASIDAFEIAMIFLVSRAFIALGKTEEERSGKTLNRVSVLQLFNVDFLEIWLRV
ncbi:hypothetical protein [Oceanibaculum indicum]|uniref:hypothetical protein n=1 Tax=Oceanibaculum indicum TaxID=526216 RepID=UPI0012EA1384|nr:hypothetical protein [Oceanibaculum indicum]